MGTDLQDIFDSFFIKFPSVNFEGKETQVYQFFKIAISKCKNNVYDNLDYVYDKILNEGYFTTNISNQTMELISTYMAKEYSFQNFTLVSARKQHIGTQAFSKLPDKKIDFESAKSIFEYWKSELENFKSEFPEYSDDR